MTSTHEPMDAVVIGGGPAGGAAAYWLASAGWRVLLVERRTFPRDKPCGDALTPRAVRQLEDMGLREALAGFHDIIGLRVVAHGRSYEHPWRDHPRLPALGKVIRRTDLDQLVADRAAAMGATVWDGCTAVGIEGDGATIRSVLVHRADTAEGTVTAVPCQYVVVASGASTPFTRELGITRDARYPLGIAHRTYFASGRADDPYIEIAMDVPDEHGKAMTGYGWVFPVGDGTVNVGVGYLTTAPGWRDINASRLLDQFVRSARDRWELAPEPECRPIAGRLPMGGCMSPLTGPNWVVAGDASGLNNPFIGEGIGYAYETGRQAAAAVDEALDSGQPDALDLFEQGTRRRYGAYFRMGCSFARWIGNPAAMRRITRFGMGSRLVMDTVLPIMDNSLGGRIGRPEVVYRVVRRAFRSVPGPWTFPPPGPPAIVGDAGPEVPSALPKS